MTSRGVYTAIRPNRRYRFDWAESFVKSDGRPLTAGTAIAEKGRGALRLPNHARSHFERTDLGHGRAEGCFSAPASASRVGCRAGVGGGLRAHRPHDRRRHVVAVYLGRWSLSRTSRLARRGVI